VSDVYVTTMQPDRESIPELEEIERALALDDAFPDEEPDTLRCPVPEWHVSER
jgi:hypothetical protein